MVVVWVVWLGKRGVVGGKRVMEDTGKVVVREGDCELVG